MVTRRSCPGRSTASITRYPGRSNSTLAASRCEPVASLTTRGPLVDECLSNTHLSAGPRVPYDWVITSKCEEPGSLAGPDSHLQCVQRQIGAQVSGDLPVDYSPGEHVD